MLRKRTAHKQPKSGQISEKLRKSAASGAKTGQSALIDRKAITSRKSSPSRICLISGMEQNGATFGDSTAALYGLAQQFARLGHTVTLLWVPVSGDKPIVASDFNSLRQWLFDNFLVRFEVLTESHELYRGPRESTKSSLSVYHYLKNNTFDAVYIAAEGGLAHFSLLAKRAGVFENAPPIVVVAHDPTRWHLEASRKFVSSKAEILTDFMERQSVAHCDHLIVTCEKLLDWMKASNWALPPGSEVIAPIPPQEWRLEAREADEITRHATSPIREIVHVSHALIGSDIALFCDALDILARDKLQTQNLTVTFAGPFESVLGEHSGGLVLKRARSWPFRIRFHPVKRHEDILSYLGRKSALAVLTAQDAQLPLFALACLDRGIPFVATRQSGLTEIIPSSAIDHTLYEPSSAPLAAILSKWVSGRNIASPTPYDWSGQRAAWEASRISIATSKRSTAAAAKTAKSLVTIVTAHYNRPMLLLQAIQSVAEQDYPHIEYIVVDDGSTSPEAKKLLNRLEPDFRRKGWRVIRQSNRYLGAARNAGIKAARGELVLFLDDDNILLSKAVSTLVQAMERTKADICTTFSRLLYEKTFPTEDRPGYINYFPTGGPLELALLYNPYGDANAMFRRNVFDRIGFLNEERGFSGSDWEFFTRADMAGLRFAVVPEALYWYRSDQTSMHRSVHWYRNRLPIIALFQRNPSVSLDLLRELTISQNAVRGEIENGYWNLEYSLADKRLMELSDLDPNSAKAMEALANVAAEEGRPDTAITLLSRTQHSDFAKRVDRLLHADERSAEASSALIGAFHQGQHLDLSRLEKFTSYNGGRTTPLFYVDDPDKLYLEAVADEVSLAVLPGGCPAGTVAVTTEIRLGDIAAEPLELMLLVAPASVDASLAVASALKSPASGGSGWCRVSRFAEPREIEARLPVPSLEPMNLIVAVRNCAEKVKKRNLGCFSKMNIWRSVDPEHIMRPRKGPPSHGLRARELDDSEMGRARLLTPYPSQLPLLLFAPNRGGIFLRPHSNGPVAAILAGIFPPLARSVTAHVEIANEDASPFEFAMALTRSGVEPEWNEHSPTNALAFSGWHRVEDTFRLKPLSVSLTERVRAPLSLTLAIKLPPRSSPAPANTFWRRLMVAWDE